MHVHNPDAPIAHDPPQLPVPVAGNLTRLSDNELLANTRDLVGASNRLLATLLAHLAEVEARGIHRSRACSSLYLYCVYELRLSEDAASCRVCAARLVKQFPVLLDAIASGELHLTGLLMLGPHLTPHNHIEVLARAKHRTKKELAQLVRVLDPFPDVPPRMEPLGPAPTRDLNPFANPSWQNFVGSMCPIRELAPGDRPRDWGNAAAEDPEVASEAHPSQPSELLGSAPARRSSSDAADLADAEDAADLAGRSGRGAPPCHARTRPGTRLAHGTPAFQGSVHGERGVRTARRAGPSAALARPPRWLASGGALSSHASTRDRARKAQIRGARTTAAANPVAAFQRSGT